MDLGFTLEHYRTFFLRRDDILWSARSVIFFLCIDYGSEEEACEVCDGIETELMN